MGRPPLLLLHPLGSHGGFWDDVRGSFGSESVLTPDLAGHGSAALPADATVAALTDAVVAELDAGTTVDVVGVSLGGLVAQDLASRYPGKVRRLVLVDTVATYPEQMKAVWQQRAAVARDQGLAGLAEVTESTWFSGPSRAVRPEVVSAAMAAFVSTDPAGYARCCEVLAGADLRSEAMRLTLPTLVVCGSEDGPAFLEAACWFAEVIPGARLYWIDGARHAAVLEQPERFAAAVRDFLSSGR